MRDHSSHKERARILASALAVPVLLATALLWGWNTFATEILGLPSMAFKHALAMELLPASIASVVAGAWHYVSARARSAGPH